MHASRSVLLLVLAIASAPSLAQFPGGGRGDSGGRGGIDGGRNIRSESRPLREPSRSDAISPGATIQAQLDAIEDSLKLTEVQRAAWFAFSDPVQKLGDMMSRLRFDARVGLPPSGSALEQLDKVADDERRRAAIVEQIIASARALYAILTTEQRALADRRFAMPVTDLTFGSLSVRADERGSVRDRR